MFLKKPTGKTWECDKKNAWVTFNDKYFSTVVSETI